MTITNTNKRVSVAAGGLVTFTYDFRILEQEDLLVILRTSAGVETTQTLTTHYTVAGVGAAGGGTITFLSAPTASSRVVMVLDPDITQTTDYSNAGAFDAEAHEEALDKLTNAMKRTNDISTRALSLTDGSTPGAGEYDADSQRIINVLDPTADQDAATLAYVAAKVAEAIITPSVTVTAAAATILDDATTGAMLDTLGFSTITKSFIARSSTAGMYSDLGTSSYAIDLIQGSTSASAARDLLVIPTQIPNANMLLNGDFQVWQHGTSFTSATIPANSDDTYTADQWILLSEGATDIVDVTKNTGSVDSLPAGAKASMDFLVTATGGDVKFGVFQPLESIASIPRRSTNVTISMWVQGNSGLSGFRFHLVSAAGGTPDVITSDIIDNWGASTSPPTLIAGWTITEPTVTNAEEGIAVLAWSRRSATFLVPATADNLGVLICTNDSAFATGDTLRITNIKMEEGSVMTPYIPTERTTEIQRCERFFTKTFDLETPPAVNLNVHEGALSAVVAGDGFTNTIATEWRLPVRMLKTPSVVTYNWGATGTGWRDDGDTATVAITAPVADKSKVYIGSAGATTLGVYYIHGTADARL